MCSMDTTNAMSTYVYISERTPWIVFPTELQHWTFDSVSLSTSLPTLRCSCVAALVEVITLYHVSSPSPRASVSHILHRFYNTYIEVFQNIHTLGRGDHQTRLSLALLYSSRVTPRLDKNCSKFLPLYGLKPCIPDISSPGHMYMSSLILMRG